MKFMVRICDRCGIEIDRQRGFRAFDAISQAGPDLCESCGREFAKFMEEGRNAKNKACEYLNFCPKCGHPMDQAKLPDGTVTWICDRCLCGPDGLPVSLSEIFRATAEEIRGKREGKE